MRTRWKYGLRMLCLVALVSAGAFAAAGGSWSGTLRDSNGNPVRGAKVQLRSGSRSMVAEAVSSEAGAFAFVGVPSGSYSVAVATGHNNWKTTNTLEVRDGESLAADLRVSAQNQELVIQPA